MRYLARLGFFLTIALNVYAVTCTFSINDLNFGSLNIASGGPFDITGTLIANCIAGSPNKTVKVCVNHNAGSGGMASSGDPRWMLNGANVLNYNIYFDAAHTIVWGSDSDSAATTSQELFVPLDGSGIGSATATLYARISSGQSSALVGVYNSYFSGVQTQIVYAETNAQCRVMLGKYTPVNAPFQVWVNYGGTCSLTTNPLNFGTMSSSGATTGNTMLGVTCPNQVPYQIALNGGLSGAVGPTQRVLSDGSGHTVTYGLYRDSVFTLPWGSTLNSNTAMGTGSGTTQLFTVYGQLPYQPSAYGGVTYTDQIQVTVYY